MNAWNKEAAEKSLTDDFDYENHQSIGTSTRLAQAMIYYLLRLWWVNLGIYGDSIRCCDHIFARLSQTKRRQGGHCRLGDRGQTNSRWTMKTKYRWFDWRIKSSWNKFPEKIQNIRDSILVFNNLICTFGSVQRSIDVRRRTKDIFLSTRYSQKLLPSFSYFADACYF